MTFSCSTFTINHSAYGGAIYSNGKSLTASSSTFASNTATGSGGAIYSNINGLLTVTHSTLKANSASYGGAIYTKNANTNVHFCRMVGNTATKGKALYNKGKTSASLNWWGSNANPSSNVYGITITRWLILTIKANPKTIPNNGYSNITADLLHENNGNLVTGYVPNRIQVTFTTTLGIISSSSTVNGAAKSTLNSGTIDGIATISARVDNQSVKTAVTIK